MPKARSRRSKKIKFHGNRFTRESVQECSSASASKLKDSSLICEEVLESKSEELTGNRIFDLQTLISVFSVLCWPSCFSSGLKLTEDSRFGLCSNFSLHCTNCSFIEGFCSSPKVKKSSNINKFFILGLRLAGRGYAAGKKLCSTLSLPFLSKSSFRHQEKAILECVEMCSQENMIMAAEEVRRLKAVPSNKICSCGVSVDGTWQRRGYSSLNGCTTIISIDTGKVLDAEIMSHYCRTCKTNDNVRYKNKENHECSNYVGSSGNMEPVGVYRMFEQSKSLRKLQYSQYYGDGDSKGFEEVKNIYGNNSVEKLECIGHVQKRVGSHLRKLKKNEKGLGGKGKLTDKLQNYYGIAIRSNVGNLVEMQSAVIAAFFHCCSGKNKEMHRQCPTGSHSWCKVQKAKFAGIKFVDKSPALPNSVVNSIKKTCMDLCDQKLLKKCLHGKTQNCNESFNNVVWSIVPKETFVELQTLRLGINIAIILFNSGFAGLLPVFQKLGVLTGPDLKMFYWSLDNTRIVD
ncbi:hypothetical protein AVEN_101579-1 [Araneus ventricosus]|uniref:Mutator-like transposase domain-containing protein n=1 Tax=Araneus ventricosus TaxID=182803 RepID=A0A4Y2DXX0_ARAVE|nr:hypothetical protein AVEN_101579-1 [Araneus ventricosus]